MGDMISREAAMGLRDSLADIIGAQPMSSIHSALSEYRNALRALPGIPALEQTRPALKDGGYGVTRSGEKVGPLKWQLRWACPDAEWTDGKTIWNMDGKRLPFGCPPEHDIVAAWEGDGIPAPGAGCETDCPICGYHYDSERGCMCPAPEGDPLVEINLRAVMMEEIEKAAGESPWVPPEYSMNEVVSDCCAFLRSPREPAPGAEPVAPPKIGDFDAYDKDCQICDEGWVCENPPGKGWPSVCDCGAGMPCKCNPLYAVPPSVAALQAPHDTIMAWGDHGPESVTGQWSANTYDRDDAVAYVPASVVAALQAEVERLTRQVAIFSKGWEIADRDRIEAEAALTEERAHAERLAEALRLLAPRGYVDAALKADSLAAHEQRKGG